VQRLTSLPFPKEKLLEPSFCLDGRNAFCIEKFLKIDGNPSKCPELLEGDQIAGLQLTGNNYLII
jgi:hypothetical protein